MKTLTDRLVDFHTKFNINVGEKPFPNVPDSQQILYHDLLIEEVTEYKDAIKERDNMKIADAFGDILFVLLSAIVENGLQDVMDEVFHEVCDSNLTKLGADGKPRFRDDGKIIKCEGYVPPRLEAIFEKHGIKRFY